MDKTNETTSVREAQDDVITLGVASVETKGEAGGNEIPGPGRLVGPGISDE